MERLTAAELEAERSRMLRRLQAVAVEDAALHRQALAELESRLQGWQGHAVPPNQPPAKSPGIGPDAAVELLIIRAISAKSDPPTFGVRPDGSVYITDAPRSSRKDTTIFVTGLSPGLDQAAKIFHALTDGNGGRFIERGGTFLPVAAASEQLPFAFVKVKSGLRHRVHRFFLNRHKRGQPRKRKLLATRAGRQKRSPQLWVKFDEGPWPAEGVLSEMGYHVGKKGLRSAERREILQKVWDVELVATSPETHAYIREWGSPASGSRLRKITGCLIKFIDLAERKTGADMSGAIADWRSDLDWLKTTYGRL